MTSSHTKSHPSVLPPEKSLSLAEHGFIKKLSPEQQRLISASSETEIYSHNSIIFYEGSASDAIYLVLKGKVLFFKNRGDHDNPHVISSCEAGDYFGEIGILTKEGRALSAKADGNVELVKIPASTINDLITHGQSPFGDVLASIIRHLQNTTQRYISEVENQEKLALVGMMMSSILHDFKNPFSLVNMATHLIRSRNTGNEELEKYCATIDRQIERMTAMMNDIIAFSQGQETVRSHHFQLSVLKNQLEENIVHLKQRGTCQIELDFCESKIVADSGKLLRALINLIDNAFDAVSAAKVDKGKVTVSARIENDKVVFAVKDNGPGIPEAIRDHFFEPFVTSKKKGGTGLGLAITKSVVDAHNGSITFTTESGEGTCFTIQLPVGDSR
jgi:signal transduction histidine kinase